ncbi:hypothetical protein D3C85_1428700 [compost metagenome]
MARIGIPVRERTDSISPLLHYLVDFLADDSCRKRGVCRSQTFCDGDKVWLDAVLIATKHGAGTTKSCDHLVSNQKDVVLLEDWLDRSPVASRGRSDTARAQHGLSNELLFSFACFSPPVIVWSPGTQDAGDRQVHVIVVEAHTGHRARNY